MNISSAFNNDASHGKSPVDTPLSDALARYWRLRANGQSRLRARLSVEGTALNLSREQYQELHRLLIQYEQGKPGETDGSQASCPVSNMRIS